MTNRILSILILILVFGAGYLYYIFEYKPNKELENLKKQEQTKQEETKKEITLDKVETKQEQNNKEAINRFSTGEINEDTINRFSTGEISRDAINRISTFNLLNLGEFYFTEENNKLNLFLEEESLGSFDLVKKEDLQIQEIIGNNNFIFIKTGENKYLYNLSSREIKKLDIKLEIQYIKIGQNEQEFLLKTPVGIFIYSLSKNEMNYFTFFEDFIYFKTGYIGIINQKEDTKLKNLDLQNETKNLIIYYDPNSKEKNILYKTDLNLTKIYINEDKVYFETDSQEKYNLNNI